MTPDEFAKQSTMALANHVAELDRIERAVTAAVKARSPLPIPSEIFGALSAAAEECVDLIEHYGDDEIIPPNVRNGVVHVQHAITDLASALEVHVAITALRSSG